MTDINIIVVKDKFNNKHVIFFEFGQLGRPIITIPSYEFDKMIIEYKKELKEIEHD